MKAGIPAKYSAQILEPLAAANFGRGKRPGDASPWPKCALLYRPRVVDSAWSVMGGVRKGPTMSLDLFMNDTCPKCRKPMSRSAVASHPKSRDLAVHKFECTSCGHVTTKILYHKPNVAAA